MYVYIFSEVTLSAQHFAARAFLQEALSVQTPLKIIVYSEMPPKRLSLYQQWLFADFMARDDSEKREFVIKEYVGILGGNENTWILSEEVYWKSCIRNSNFQNQFDHTNN